MNEIALDWICSAVKMATGGVGAIWSSKSYSEHSITRSSSSRSSSSSSGSSSSDGDNEDNTTDLSINMDVTSDRSDDPILGVTSPPLDPSSDVLELYCGNGNHTVAIAGEE